MSDLFWINDARVARLEPFVPKPHGKRHADDRRALSGVTSSNEMVYVGAMPPKSSVPPYKTLYKRWSNKGIYVRMITGLAAEHCELKTVMIPLETSLA